MSVRRQEGETRNGAAEIRLNGAELTADPSGALLWPARRTLVVADLHLEKGSAFAARGQFLPPYDTRATLGRLEALVSKHRPKRVICLGDSFHDGGAGERLAAAIARANQKVKGMRARLTDYQAEFKRYTELVKTGAASRERVDQAVADVADQEALVEGSLAELAAAQAKKSQAEADLVRDIANLGAEGAENARLRTAKARVHSAHLNVEFTEVINDQFFFPVL